VSLKVEKFEGDSWYRLIPSRFPPVDIYKLLAPVEDWPDLYSLENTTNPRLQQRERLARSGEASDEASLQNWNHAPFAYPNPEGGWLNDPVSAALELACDRQTALAVSIRKRERFLARTKEPPMEFDMRMLTTPISGRFIDLTTLPMNLSERERWDKGAQARDSEADGAVFVSPHRPGARCIVVFRGSSLGRTVQAEHFRFLWDGVAIRKIYNFGDGSSHLAEEILSASSWAA
jgi:hypothetical protein